MGQQHHPVEVDPQVLDHARDQWQLFTEVTKYAVIAVATLLLVMWATLV